MVLVMPLRGSPPYFWAHRLSPYRDSKGVALMTKLTAKQAAEILDVTAGTVGRHCRNGLIKAEKVQLAGTNAPQWMMSPEAIAIFQRTRPKKPSAVNSKFGQLKAATQEKSEKDPGEVFNFVLDYLPPNGHTCVNDYNVRRFNGRNRRFLKPV